MTSLDTAFPSVRGTTSVDTSISRQVPVLEGLLSYWGLEKAHIVAHDIGCGIAQRFAVFTTERVRSCTLIDVVSFDSQPSELTRQQMQNGLGILMKAAEADHRAHFREWLLSTVQNKQKLAHSSLDTYVEYISGPVGQGSLFQHQVRHYDPEHTMEIADRLHELGSLPVKLIWGENDGWQTTDWAHKLNRAIHGSELEILENCGHFAPEDQPEELARSLVSFLDQHSCVR